MPEQQLLYIVPTVITVVLILILLVYLSIKAHLRKVETGHEGIVGERGEIKGGKAFVHGELWKVRSDDTLEEGDSIVVVGVESMILQVQKAKKV